MQHGNHLKQMLIVGAVVLAGAIALGVPTGSALFASAILACPIGMGAMMFFMMRGSQGQGATHDHQARHPHDSAPQSARASIEPLG